MGRTTAGYAAVMADRAQLVSALLDEGGRTFADEAGIELADAPGPLYRLLVLTVLLSSRVSSRQGVAACRELLDAGMDTPERMRDADRRARVDALDRARYTRTDEKTAVALAEGATLVLDRWDGDLRRMRAAADGDAGTLAGFLTDVPQIGPVGADIFTREVQGVWPEFRPHLDPKALAGAEAVGLPRDPEALAALVDGDDLPRLAAALVRAGRDHDLAEDVAGS